MKRVIKAMEEKYLLPALELVDAVFTASECAENGKLVRCLVEEIRSKRFYLPELELIMVDSDTDRSSALLCSPGSIWMGNMKTNCCSCPRWR